MSNTFLQEQITATEALILVYQNAVVALVADGTQRYVLDTGQTRQDVTSIDIPKLNAQIDGLYNRRATLIARCNGSGVLVVRPGW